MAYIDIIEIEDAEGIVKQEYDKGVRRSGRVFNILKIMSLSPTALKESMRMYLAIMYGESELSRAQREMLATVVSQVNHCYYWIEAHGDDFRDEVKDKEKAQHLKHNWQTADLSEEDKALCSWAVKLTRTPAQMLESDVRDLEAFGFSQNAISDAAQVIRYFNYINRIADGLGVDLEPEMERWTTFNSSFSSTNRPEYLKE